MATLAARVASFIESVGADVKALFGRSVPPGGAAGQVLAKAGSADYNLAWVDAGATGTPGAVVAVQAGKPLWRGFVSANGLENAAGVNGYPFKTTFSSGASVSAFYNDFTSPLRSIPGLLTLNLNQTTERIYAHLNLGIDSAGGTLFARGQSARFQGSIRFGFLGEPGVVFFAGAAGGHPSGSKNSMTGAYALFDSWTSSSFGSSSGFVGACLGIGWEPGDVNLQFMSIKSATNAIKVDSGVSIASLVNTMLELTFELKSGGTKIGFLLKNVDTDTDLCSATVDIPTLLTAGHYTIAAGIGNRGVSTGNQRKLAISHMLFANAPGGQSS